VCWLLAESAMHHLQRNTLVWLTPAAWDAIEAQDWDAEARELLALWQQRRLPLVVGRKRCETAVGQISLGLPAPKDWGYRRFALAAPEQSVSVSGLFPTLLQVSRARRWPSALNGFALAMSERRLRVSVYGSHGWQHLTGMPYVHRNSDLDVSVQVDDLQTAMELVNQLQALQEGPRLDGEMVFPSGRAIAWRELHQLAHGQVTQVLLKDRDSVVLANMDALPPLLQRAVREVPEACTAFA
jgi:phosphoribosyl-dephospho-CoA transferase